MAIFEGMLVRQLDMQVIQTKTVDTDNDTLARKTTGLKFKIIPWHLISDTLLQLMNFCSCFVIHIHVYIGKCIIPPPPSPFPFQVKIKMGTELCFSIYLKVLKFLKVTMQIK